MRKILLLIVLLFCFFSVFSSSPVLAQSNNELLASGQIIDSDYIRAGQIVQVDGEIKGDAFLIGGLVTVNGKIDGDLFVLGGKVTINGEVGNSIRVLGGDVVVNGPVNRNVLLLCGSCSVTRQSTIIGSVLVAGGNFEVSATKVGRGFRFFGNRLYLNSDVANETFVVADQEFLLGPAASISGELKYTGNTEAILEPGATVAGKIYYQKNSADGNFPRFFNAKEILSSYRKIKPLTDLFGLSVSLLIGFVMLGLFPKGFEKVVMAIENRPYASFGWGLVAALIIPVTVVLFALTIVGIPVSLVLIIVGYLAWIVIQYLAAFFIGRKILLKRFGERRGWALVLGLILIYFLGLIPVLGSILKLVLFLLGLGALILSYKQPAIVRQRQLPFEEVSPKRRGRGQRLSSARV